MGLSDRDYMRGSGRPAPSRKQGSAWRDRLVKVRFLLWLAWRWLMSVGRSRNGV